MDVTQVRAFGLEWSLAALYDNSDRGSLHFPLKPAAMSCFDSFCESFGAL